MAVTEASSSFSEKFVCKKRLSRDEEDQKPDRLSESKKPRDSAPVSVMGEFKDLLALLESDDDDLEGEETIQDEKVSNLMRSLEREIFHSSEPGEKDASTFDTVGNSDPVLEQENTESLFQSYDNCAQMQFVLAQEEQAFAEDYSAFSLWDSYQYSSVDFNMPLLKA